MRPSTKGCCLSSKAASKGIGHRNSNSIGGFIEVRQGSATTAFPRSPRLCHSRCGKARRHYHQKLMAKELDPLKLSSPRIFLFRMLVFVILCRSGRLRAAQADRGARSWRIPGLNALIIGVEAIGIIPSLPPGVAALSGDRLGQQFPPR